MNKLKTLQLIHIAYCMAILLFSVIIIAVNFQTLHINIANLTVEPLLIIAPAFAVISIIASRSIFVTMVDRAKNNMEFSVASKLTQYQTAFIVKAAFLEGAALFNIVVLLITSNLFTLFFAGFCLIALWLSKPTKEKVAEDLNLQDTNTLDGI